MAKKETRNFENSIKYYKEFYNLENRFKEKVKGLSMMALCEYYNNAIDSSKYHFQQVENHIEIILNNSEYEYAGDGSDVYYLDWPLYKYFFATGDMEKAEKYLKSAYNHLSIDERNKYLLDINHTENIHKYYYMHEIIDAYNQMMR